MIFRELSCEYSHNLENFGLIGNAIFEQDEYISNILHYKLILRVEHRKDFLQFISWLTSRGIREMAVWLNGHNYTFLPMVGSTRITHMWSDQYQAEIPVYIISMGKD